MTIQLTQNVRLSGAPVPAGSQLSLPTGLEASLISANQAVRIPRELAGLNIYAFNDHTTLAVSGAEAASYTLSTVSGYNGIPATDTDSGVAEGSKTGSDRMVKLVVSGQAGVANTFLTSAASLNLATLDDRFGIWVFVSCAIAGNSNWQQPTINVNVSANNNFFGDANDYTFSFNGNQIRQGWNFLVLKCSATNHPFGVTKSGVGTVDFSAPAVRLNRFRIFMTVPAGRTLTMYFDTLWSNFRTRPRVCIGTDDTGSDHLRRFWEPILRNFGIPPGYVALIAESTDDTTRLTGGNFNTSITTRQTDNVDHVYAAGWDIVNHGLKHANTSNDTSLRTQLLTDGQLAYQVLGQRFWQLAHGWERGADIWTAPQGRWDSVTIARLREWGFTLARMGAQGWNCTRTVFGYAQPLNMGWISIDAPPVGAANLANWQTMIQGAIDYGGDVIIGAHQVIAGGNADGSSVTGNTLQIFDTGLIALCAWLRQKEDANEIELCRLTDMRNAEARFVISAS